MDARIGVVGLLLVLHLGGCATTAQWNAVTPYDVTAGCRRDLAVDVASQGSTGRSTDVLASECSDSHVQERSVLTDRTSYDETSRDIWYRGADARQLTTMGERAALGDRYANHAFAAGQWEVVDPAGTVQLRKFVWWRVTAGDQPP
jgi:hypothetical protein